MHITIDKPIITKALQHVTSVVERRNTIPILANIKLEAVAPELMKSASSLRLTSTDLDMEMSEAIDADVVSGGAVTVPAHTMLSIVSKLPDKARVEITLDGDRVKVKAGSFTTRLSCLPVDDFPEFGKPNNAARFELQRDELARMLRRPRFAVSTDETRYYLNGIYLCVVDGKLRTVATDGHRLACINMQAPDGIDDMPNVILPRKLVDELLKLLPDAASPIAVEISPTRARFTAGNVVLTSKLIEGTFPDYQRVIPTGNDIVCRVNKAALVAAVDRVSILSNEKGRAEKFAFANDTLTVSVHNPEKGSAHDELPAETGGRSIEIGFNARYVLDMASQIDGDSVEFRMYDNTAPTLITDGDDALFVIMPLRC